MTGSRGKRDYGYVVMVEDQKNYLLNQRVAALRFNPSVALPKFFEYYHDSVSNYCETTSIDLEQYFWSLIYDSPIEDMRKELKDNTKELKSIGKSIDIMAKAQQEEREQNHA